MILEIELNFRFKVIHFFKISPHLAGDLTKFIKKK